MYPFPLFPSLVISKGSEALRKWKINATFSFLVVLYIITKKALDACLVMMYNYLQV